MPVSIDHELHEVRTTVADLTERLRSRLDRNSTRAAHLAVEAAEVARDALKNAREWHQIDERNRGRRS